MIKEDNNAESNDLAEALKANEEFKASNDAMAKELEEMKAQLKKAKDDVRGAKAALTKSKNRQVVNSTRFEAENTQVGQDGTAHFDDDSNDLIHVEQGTLDDPWKIDKLKMLEFMNEPVEVEIHTVSDDSPTAYKTFDISINGETEWFTRGQVKTVKRMFVYGLCTAKKTGYGCREQKNPHTGRQEYVYDSDTGLRYPFSVINDTPEGFAWLRRALREA